MQASRRQSPRKTSNCKSNLLNNELYYLLSSFRSFIENIAPFIGAISEGLHRRTGMMVSVMLTGPIPSDNGRIGVRRCVSQSTMTISLLTKLSFHFGDGTEVDEKPLWPQFDPAGFEATEKSLCALGASVFSPEDCQRRALRSDTSKAAVPNRAASEAAQPVPASPAPGSPAEASPPTDDAPQRSPPLSSQPPSSPAPPRSTPDPLPSLPAISRVPSPAAPAAATPSTAATTALKPSRPRPRPRHLSNPTTTVATASQQSQASHSVSPVEKETRNAGGDDYSPHSALVDADCPPVLLKAFRPVIEASFDPAWRTCIKLFVQHQINAEFSDPGRGVLPPGPRPVEFSDWFKIGRRDNGPQISSYPDFLQRLDVWWKAMQPAVRGPTKQARPATTSPEDWVALIKPGKLGVFLVITGLYWVGRPLYHSEMHSLREKWSALLEDVIWVLEHNVPPPTLSEEESSDDSAEATPEAEPALDEQSQALGVRKRSSRTSSGGAAKRKRR